MSRSDFGALWKEEGYAELIAGDNPISLEEGLQILNGKATAQYVPHIEYFKYWLGVRHLMQQHKMTFVEILHAELDFKQILEEAIQMENNRLN